MPNLFADSDIKSGGKIAFKRGDAVSEAAQKELGNAEQLVEAGVLVKDKPEPHEEPET